eukprot:CAMPEP_0183792186 /NCGR_PEP_ID=MMETSP0803_2-20130417/2397_1 /TAXON_ID=195967 /ORGANISM="Crustomastix stigmata, Strain CCMP3273" /LENGTH=53 /DNA_ID=CAMNT_0026036529 /DNA_START=9 /DNA_END=167 /DNA_ORIENTATION=-
MPLQAAVLRPQSVSVEAEQYRLHAHHLSRVRPVRPRQQLLQRLQVMLQCLRLV